MTIVTFKGFGEIVFRQRSPAIRTTPLFCWFTERDRPAKCGRLSLTHWSKAVAGCLAWICADTGKANGPPTRPMASMPTWKTCVPSFLR